MNKLAALAGLLLAGNSLWAQETIRLRSRNMEIGRVRQPLSRLRRDVHYILVFPSYPTDETRQALVDRGIRILQYVPDSALMVSIPRAANLEGLEIEFAATLDASDKISPGLAANSTNTYLLIFHIDVSPPRARELAQAAGFDVIDSAGVLPNQLIGVGVFDRLKDLAANDELAYVLPASPDLISGSPVMGCPGPITEAGPIGEYVAASRGWTKDANGAVALKYFPQLSSEKMDPNSVRGEIDRAFREWSRYANISLTPGERADAARTIAIRFLRGAHGDGYPFDGPGRVLAHTFYPAPAVSEPLAGDMHLDAEEAWRIGVNIDLYSVVLHKAGHALGLGHSSQPGAVMYPYYRMATGLAADDINGIQSLYGMASQAALPPAQPPVQPPVQPPTNPSTKDITPPSLRIQNPGTTIISTSSTSIAMNGTASDDIALSSVKWISSGGASGVAAGSNTWSANIPLLVGTNVITVRAYDVTGNSTWRAVTVVRR